MKNLLILVIILTQFDASAQIIFRLTSLSKEDKIDIRNFSNRRLTDSQKFNRMETIEMDFDYSDSLVIRKEGFIPIALVNLDNLTTKEINLELPVLSKYEAIDTLITYTTKSKFLSNKTETERYEYSPMNSQYLDTFPGEISVTINDKQYFGFLKKEPFESVSNLDGKKFCKSVFCLGIEAIYVISGIEK
jgi:peptidoglycan hydrolase-like amidase